MGNLKTIVAAAGIATLMGLSNLKSTYAQDTNIKLFKKENFRNGFCRDI